MPSFRRIDCRKRYVHVVHYVGVYEMFLLPIDLFHHRRQCGHITNGSIDVTTNTVIINLTYFNTLYLFIYNIEWSIIFTISIGHHCLTGMQNLGS